MVNYKDMSDKLLNFETREADKEKLLNQQRTDRNKKQTINEFRNCLGAEMKKNPNKIKVTKKTGFQKFMLVLKNIFTKF